MRHGHAVLIRGKLGIRHARSLRVSEQQDGIADLLGCRDLLVGGHQAIEHSTHLVGKLDIQAGKVLVDADQPAFEAGESAGKFRVGRLAFRQVRFKAAGELFVLLNSQRLALFGSDPLADSCGVPGDLLRGILAGSDIVQHFEIEVTQLMQQRGQVALIAERDLEPALLAGLLAWLEGDKAAGGFVFAALLQPLLRIAIHSLADLKVARLALVFDEAKAPVKLDQAFLVAAEISGRSEGNALAGAVGKVDDLAHYLATDARATRVFWHDDTAQ
ncbi:hypothetical protein D9M71_483420 [compost metagenome]